MATSPPSRCYWRSCPTGVPVDLVCSPSLAFEENEVADAGAQHLAWRRCGAYVGSVVDGRETFVSVEMANPV